MSPVPTHAQLAPLTTITHQSGMFVTIGEPTWINCCDPKSMVYIRAYSWCSTLHGFGQVCNDIVRHYSVVDTHFSFKARDLQGADPLRGRHLLNSQLKRACLLLLTGVHWACILCLRRAAMIKRLRFTVLGKGMSFPPLPPSSVFLLFPLSFFFKDLLVAQE